MTLLLLHKPLLQSEHREHCWKTSYLHCILFNLINMWEEEDFFFSFLHKLAARKHLEAHKNLISSYLKRCHILKVHSFGHEGQKKLEDTSPSQMSKTLK